MTDTNIKRRCWRAKDEGPARTPSIESLDRLRKLVCYIIGLANTRKSGTYRTFVGNFGKMYIVRSFRNPHERVKTVVEKEKDF